MNKPRQLPDINRLSVLAAAILLAYALARFIDLPSREFAIQLPGLYLNAQISVRTIVALLVAGMAFTGADWLLRAHPDLQNHPTFEHLLLPALTAWIIGIPLYDLPLGILWWVGFAVGGVLLISVLIAEYVTVNPNDVRVPVAAAGLTALSFALYLTLAISLRIGGFRLVFTLPALTLAVWLVSLRTLHLRLKGYWAIVQASLIALIIAQATAALHYLPLSPVTYGLILLALSYALTSLIGNLAEGQPFKRAITEPALVLVIVLGSTVWIR